MIIKFSHFSILTVLLISQHIFCMEPQALVNFTEFSKLPAEIRKNIFQYSFKYSDNKNDFQLVNKEWSKNYSIQSATLFNNNENKDCCNLSPQHMTRILLCAAYNKNYEGVENILKNSNILDLVENRLPHFCIDTYIPNNRRSLSLNPHSIALYNDDKQMSQLLNQYTVATFESKIEIGEPIDLLMNCLAGNSNEIVKYSQQKHFDEDAIYNRLEKCLYVAIDSDHEKCIKILFDTPGLKNHRMFCYLTCEDTLPKRAFHQKNFKAFKVLLELNCDRMCLMDDIEYSNAALSIRKDIETAKKLTAEKEQKIEKTQQNESCLIS
jgi:hypothetical protein